MSKLRKLLEIEYEGKDIQEKVYGLFPFEIASECGPEAIREVIRNLDTFQSEKEKIEDWDGDSQNDFWRLQGNYSELLELLTSKYPQEVVAGLESDCNETRFWASHSLAKVSTAIAIPGLTKYLESDMPEHYRSTVKEALYAGKAKRSLFVRLFKRDAEQTL